MKSLVAKELIIGIMAVSVLAILMNGNEIGHFRNDDRTDPILLPILYLLSLAIFYALLKGKVKLKINKQNLIGIIFILILAVLPMFLLAGAIKYVDYYTTNKKWEKFRGVITSRSQRGGGRSGPIYNYTIKDADTSLKLSSKLYYEIGQDLKLKFCRTNLGITVADLDIEKQRTTVVADAQLQAKKRQA